MLKDLPNKTERIEWCDMTDLQRSIYRETLQRSRKTILEVSAADSAEHASSKPPKKSKPALRQKEKSYSENSSNVLMDLRKAASHPMLFRTRFTDETLTGITKQLLKEPDFKRRGAIFDLVKEDMSVMTDSELQIFCASYKVWHLAICFTSMFIDYDLAVHPKVSPRKGVLCGCWKGAITSGPPRRLYSAGEESLDILSSKRCIPNWHILYF